MNTWIKCTDQMPPPDKSVLVYNDDVGYTVAWTVWELLKDHIGILGVNNSYWMELPKGPHDE